MKESQKKIIGERVRKCRKEMGISQEALAEKLGMKRTNVANYEAGRVVPPGTVLLEMAELFNVTTDYLLGISDDPTYKLEDEDLLQIQRKRKTLKPKDRRRMDKMIEMLTISFVYDEDEDEDEEDL